MRAGAGPSSAKLTNSARSLPLATVRLMVEGLGLILYSPFATAHIQQGEDYLEPHFWLPEDVAAHVNRGTISALGTGSPGDYIVRFFLEGDEDQSRSAANKYNLTAYKCKLALFLEIRDRTLCIRDLYDLMTWDPSWPIPLYCTMAG